MSRFLAVLMFLCTGLAAHAQTQPQEAGEALARAMQSLREGNWAAAQIRGAR
ncbi:hypothetical protein [Ponticoccus litoralis]|uniref:Uncharacterized protein n=1 Tax=Ponticoccus litoralis TaxID=422297 RepID=A0AAW9SHV3_9RHOB